MYKLICEIRKTWPCKALQISGIDSRLFVNLGTVDHFCHCFLHTKRTKGGA